MTSDVDDWAPVGGADDWTPVGETRAPKTSGYLANIGASVNDAIAGGVGLPVDLATGATNLASRGIKAATGYDLGQIENPVGGSESIKRLMGFIGADPDQVEAPTRGQRFVRSVAGGAASMLVPQLGAEALAGRALSPLAEGARTMFAGAGDTMGGRAASNAAIGAASGAGQSGAEAIAPKGYEAPAGFAGNLAAGMGAALFHHALGSLAQRPTVEQEAGRRLKGSLSDADAAQRALIDHEESPLYQLPTSRTTAQVTGDLGAGQMENWARNQRPEEFTARAAVQNASDRDLLESVAKGESPSAAAEWFRRQTDRIDQAYQTVVSAAAKHASDTLDRIGGQRFGTTDQATAREQYGDQVRDFVQEGANERNKVSNRLWSAAMQNGDLVFDHRPTLNAVRDALTNLNPAGGDVLTPVERRLYATIGGWDGPQEFDNIKTMRTNIGDAADVAFRAGDRQAGKRLLTVRAGLDQSVESALMRRVADERQAVASGQLDPQHTFEGWLTREAQGQNGPQQAAATGQRPGAAAPGAGPGSPEMPPPRGTPPVPGNSGAAGEASPVRSDASAGVAGNQRVAPIQFGPGELDGITPELLTEKLGLSRAEADALLAKARGNVVANPAPVGRPVVDVGTTPEPSTPASGTYRMYRPDELTLDPKRFQYKEADEKGVTGALAGTNRWEPHLANPITVFEDVDGKNYVVNGHQRTDLAQRAVAAGQEDVRVPARVFRAEDGYTPEFMKSLGAYQNIAEGSGTAVDAAKIMRAADSVPKGMTLPSLPPRSNLVQQAKGLSGLSDEAFGAVVNGVVEPAYASYVGELIRDPIEQMAALDVLRRGNPANAAMARFMVQDVRDSGFLKGNQTTLFGDESFAQSLVPERAKVMNAAQAAVRKAKSVFGAAVSGEDTLAGAGNKLSTEGNIKAKADNERVLDFLDREGTVRGPLSDRLTAAAREIADGKPIAAVVSRFLADAREIERRGPAPSVEPRNPDGGDGHEGPGFFQSRRIVAPGQSDIFGGEQSPSARRAAEPTIKNDPRQQAMPGMEPTARQAQAARDQAGPRTGQLPADQGLFGRAEPHQPTLPSRPEVSQPHAKVAEDVQSLGQSTGHEHLGAYDAATGNPLPMNTSGEKGFVSFTPEYLSSLNDPNARIITHHNHPGNMSFSQADIGSLSMPGHAVMVVHGAGGDTFVASRGPGLEGMAPRDIADRLVDAYAATNIRLRSRLQDQISSGRLSAATGNAFHADLISRVLHDKGLIDYRTTLVIPAQHEALFNQLVREVSDKLSAGKNATPDRVSRPSVAIRSGEGLEGVLANAEATARRQPGSESRAGAGPPSGGNAPPTGGQGRFLEGDEVGSTAERYARARAYTKETHRIFDNTPAGRVIARGPYGAPGKMSSSDAAKQFFKSKGRVEDWDNFVDAVGGKPEALAALRDYAAFDLRSKAAANGQLDVKKYASWVKDHAEQLSRSPDLQAKFATAAEAQRTLDAAVTAKAEAIRDYEKSAASHFLGTEDPVDAMGKAFTTGDAIKNTRSLMAMAAKSGDPAVIGGLRRATLEWLMRRAAPEGVAGKEAGQTGTNWINNQTFRNLVDRHRGALAQVFGPEQMRVLDQVAESLRMSDRTITGSKPPIGPGTARDIAAMERYGGSRGHTLLNIIREGGIGFATYLGGHALLGPLGGAAAYSAGYAARRGVGTAVSAMKSVREDQIKNLIIDALLDPAKARILLQKATPQNTQSFVKQLAARTAQTSLGYQSRMSPP